MNDSKLLIILMDGENEIKAVCLIIFDCIFGLTKDNAMETIWPWRGEGEDGVSATRTGTLRMITIKKLIYVHTALCVVKNDSSLSS